VHPSLRRLQSGAKSRAGSEWFPFSEDMGSENGVMWVKQCHKPPHVDGLYMFIPPIYGDLGLYDGFNHIIATKIQYFISRK